MCVFLNSFKAPRFILWIFVICAFKGWIISGERRKIEGKITEKRGILIKTPVYNKQLSKLKRKIFHSWLWGICRKCSDSRMTLKCSQSVHLSVFRVHVYHEVSKEVRKKGWNGNHLRFSQRPDPGSLGIIKRGMIYGLPLSESRACVIYSSYWESKHPWKNCLWLPTDQTDHHGCCGLSLNTPLNPINPDPLSSRLTLLSSDAGGGWSAAWTSS